MDIAITVVSSVTSFMDCIFCERRSNLQKGIDMMQDEYAQEPNDTGNNDSAETEVGTVTHVIGNDDQKQ